jgi:MFS transporter, OPA family, glycerol-3-phosphate transporter
MRAPPDPARSRRVVFTTLLVGYASFYLCRANVDAAVPLLVEDGWSKTRIGGVLSIAVACYAIGKVVLGAVGDVLGGKRIMLVAIAGSVVATVGIGLSAGFAAFAAFAMMNRFFQSGGWGGLVHVVARWFPPARHGAVMGALSTSYEIGNVCALVFCGALARSGLGWRALFLVNPAIFALVGVGVALMLKGEPPRVASPDAAPSEPKMPLREALPWLAKKPAFWATVTISMLLTFVRTGFLTWTPTYLAEVAKASGSASAISDGIIKSAIFPATGIVAALSAGPISDKLGPGRRAPVIVVSLAVHVVAVLALAHLKIADPTIATIAIGACGLFLLGPYSLLAGALTLDVAGKRAAATAAGIVDGAGYAAGALVGVVIGGVADRWGWSAAFDVIACAGLAAMIIASLWWRASRARA